MSFPKKLCIPIRAPLHEKDSEVQTFGCRQYNPNICAYGYLDGICAFVTNDNICYHPSKQWKKIYKELKEREIEVSK